MTNARSPPAPHRADEDEAGLADGAHTPRGEGARTPIAAIHAPRDAESGGGGRRRPVEGRRGRPEDRIDARSAATHAEALTEIEDRLQLRRLSRPRNEFRPAAALRQPPVDVPREPRAGVQLREKVCERAAVHLRYRAAPLVRVVHILRVRARRRSGAEDNRTHRAPLLLPHETGLPVRDRPVAVAHEAGRGHGGEVAGLAKGAVLVERAGRRGRRAVARGNAAPARAHRADVDRRHEAAIVAGCAVGNVAPSADAALAGVVLGAGLPVVAGLAVGGGRVTALRHAAHAVLDRAGAGARAAGGRAQALVDCAVAVVVHAIASLFRRRPGGAGLRHAAHAVPDRAGAGARAAGGRAQALVDRAVAVVVDAIASLARRRPRGAGLRHAAYAVVDRPRAGPHSTGRRSQVLIDRSVAVVVTAVADFRTTRGTARSEPDS